MLVQSCSFVCGAGFRSNTTRFMVPVKAYGVLSFAHRRSRIMVNLAAFYDGLADKDVRETRVEDSLRRCARATRAPTGAS